MHRFYRLDIILHFYRLAYMCMCRNYISASCIDLCRVPLFLHDALYNTTTANIINTNNTSNHIIN